MSEKRAEFLDAAERIAARLCRDAIWAGRACNWLGWTRSPRDPQHPVSFVSLGPDLYEGTAGIALFLARLYPWTGDPILRTTLQGALNHTRRGLDTLPDDYRISYYIGTAGIAYVMIEAGQALAHDGLIEQGLSELSRLASITPAANALDVISGSAGAIPLLLDVAARFQRDDLRQLALHHGELLLRSAEQGDDGWSWEPSWRRLQYNLTGFSHGAAGFATALAELFAVSGDERFREGAVASVRYERNHFCPHQGNWPDYRNFENFPAPDKPLCAISWCHGAPGIGLSRLRFWELHQRDEEMDEEIETALTTTRNWFDATRFPTDGNYSLCHGAAGNAELLLLAAEVLQRYELGELAETIGRRGLAQFQSNNLPWPCGVEQAGETPNFMLGLAGIGYFYLRLHAPQQIPSPLLLRPANGHAAGH